MTSRYGGPRPQTSLGISGAQWLQGYLVYSEAVEPGVQVWEHRGRARASAAEASAGVASGSRGLRGLYQHHLRAE